jgi:hypothetical protein
VRRLRGLAWTLPTVVLVTSCALGCTPHVYSPPARITPLETARPTPTSDVALQVSGGHHSEMWGIEASSFAIRTSHGLSDDLDVNVSSNLTHIIGEGAANPHPNIYTARAGVRYAPAWLADFVAFTGGVGGGYSAGGGALSGDIGINVAWQNDYLVPFAASSFFLSQPIRARAVDVTLSDDPVGTDIQIPDTTWGSSTTLGVFIPIHYGSLDHARPGGLYLAMAITSLSDGEDGSVLIGFTPGIEIGF